MRIISVNFSGLAVFLCIMFYLIFIMII